MRSSLNFFLLNSLNLEDDIFVKRLFKFFYNSRPIQPKYKTFWPVSKLLEYLKSWSPLSSLDLKSLTLKTIALLALTTSDRGQTLHLISTKNISISDSKLKFVINEKTKTTRKFLKPQIISCVSSSVPELDVAEHVKTYLERTSPFREDTNFFLSWKTRKPVSKPTLSRWLTLVLKKAGIDTNKYQAHSFRGAGLSKALNSGASIAQIVAAGNWTNAKTFLNYYNAPSYDSDIGRIILEG